VSWQFTPYALPSLIAATVCLAMIPGVWRRRPAPGASAFFWLLVSLAVWSLAEVFAAAQSGLAARIWLHKVRYLGVAAAPVAWLAFTLAYTGFASFLSKGVVALLGLVPLTTVVLAFTNESHRWLWRRIEVSQNGPFPALLVEHGPWFSVQAAYAFMLVLAATALAAWALSQSPHQRAQLVTFTAAPLVACGTNLLHILGGGPLPALERPRAHLRLLADFVAYHLSEGRPLGSFDVLAGLMPDPPKTEGPEGVLPSEN